MTQVFDLILRGGTVVTPGGEARTDIGIIGERIARIGDLSQAAAGEIYGAAGLHILPGVIDTQVHFREPGLEYKADLETEARSAALGGVVAVFEMPNTNPSTITPDLMLDKLSRAKGRMDIDHAFYAGATHDNVAVLPEMERMLGCCGVKVFMGASTGDLLIKDDAGVEAVLRAIKRRAAFHSEDEYPSRSAATSPSPATGTAISSCAMSRPPSPPRAVCSVSPARPASASTSSTSPPPRRWTSW